MSDKKPFQAGRPKLSILPRAPQVYTTRALEYGGDKYSRGNYYGGCPDGVTPVERVLAYIDATQRHLLRVTEAINRALGTGGDVVAAIRTVDDVPSGKFPASSLFDLAHAMASLSLGITCAVEDGLLPEDPGQPWRVETGKKDEALPQKDIAASVAVTNLGQGEWIVTPALVKKAEDELLDKESKVESEALRYVAKLQPCTTTEVATWLPWVFPVEVDKALRSLRQQNLIRFDDNEGKWRTV